MPKSSRVIMAAGPASEVPAHGLGAALMLRPHAAGARAHGPVVAPVRRHVDRLCVFAQNGIVTRVKAARRVLLAAAVLLLTVVLSPLIVVAGEPLRRRVLARPGRYRVRRPGPSQPSAVFSYGPVPAGHVSWRRRGLWMVLVSNPLWIALTAPSRWLLDRTSGYRRRGWRGSPPAAGVREPRRPKPSLPSAAVALAEPRTEPVLARLLGSAVRGLGHRDDREEQLRRHRGRRPNTRRGNDPAG
jgi:hypothetical protein